MIDKIVEHHSGDGIKQFQEGRDGSLHVPQTIIIKEDGSRTSRQSNQRHEKPVTLGDLGKIADMPSNQYDDQHDDRGESIAEEG